MKYFFLFFVFICQFISFSQNNELHFNIEYGLANIFKTHKQIGTLNYDYNRVTNFNRLGSEFQYSFRISKKKIFLTTGVSFIKSSFHQKILDKTLKNIDNIYIKSNHININIIGVSKLVNLYEDKISLNFGIMLLERLFFKKVQTYSSEYKSSNQSWIKYRYNLTTYQSNFFLNDSNIKKRNMHLNFKYNLFLNFKLTNKIHFNLGLQYVRDYILFYDYSYDILYYKTNSTNPFDNFSFEGYTNNTKFGVKYDFLSFKIGTTYKF